MLDPVRLTERLVGLDTVSVRSNNPLTENLADLLAGFGARVQVLPKPGDPSQTNILAWVGPEPVGRAGLALAGHMDTVPWDASMRATTRPERDGRKLYGRGTCDMKGAIAAMVCALSRIDRSALRKPLALAFTYQEEIGCLGAKHLAQGVDLPVEHCIIGEPTGLRPVTQHKGYVIARVQLRGVACHSSDPDRGVSAIHAGALAVDALLGLGARWKERRDPTGRLQPPWTTLNVGLFDGGAARNMVPARASFTVEVRPLPGQDPALLLDEIEAAARVAAERIPGVGVDLERLEIEEPLATADDAPIVRWLAERTGRPAGSVPFYTEGAFFTDLGATTVICGPGGIEQAHRVDEWVELDALEEAAELYRAAIEEHCT